jgi:hypothetical protein
VKYYYVCQNTAHRLFQTLGKPENQALYAAGSAEAWSEVEALLRLCHMASFNSRNKELDRNHGHTADMLYVVTLLAAMGPLSMRIENYGTAMTLMQSLHMSSDPTSNPSSAFLQECTSPKTLRLFGLGGNVLSGHYGVVDPASDDERLDNIEEVTKLMLRAVATSGHKMGTLPSPAVQVIARLHSRPLEYLAITIHESRYYHRISVPALD